MAIVLSHPIPGAPLSDAFGWRDAIPGVIGAGLHNGQDYKADAGTLICAAHGGTVVYNGWDPTGGGWMVRIAGSGFATLYLHMREQSPLVQVGQYVGVGVGIGYVGSSGASTGPHLHFMLEKNGAYVDPVPYIKTAAAKPSTPKPSGQEEDEDMATIVVRDTNGNRPFRIYNPVTGKLGRTITREDNAVLRSAESASKGAAVAYATVTPAEFDKLAKQ